MKQNTFLSAEWEYLAMFNYEVDPAILLPHMPPGTELDLYQGKTLISIVGFLFNQTKVFGIHWPLHTNFEEVNLRYYIKHFNGEEWKRGVGFISEIVPKRIIATTANLLYNEHYSCAKMSHEITFHKDSLTANYYWQPANQTMNKLEVTAKNELQPILAGSEEEFIFEHYYGYNQLNKNTTIQYTVAHPRWQVFPVSHYSLTCDIAANYGEAFVPFITGRQPHSVFLAKGSAVTVQKPIKLFKGGTVWKNTHR